MTRAAVCLFIPTLLLTTSCRRERNSQPVSGRELFRLTFGVGDHDPADWSGSATGRNGRIVTLAPWHFDKTDRLDPQATAWHCSTRLSAVLDPKYWWLGALHVVPKNMTPPKPSLILNGLYLGTDGASEIAVRTGQGNFQFQPAEIEFGFPKSFLAGRVTVERVPVARNLTASDGLEDDYPAISTGSDGDAFIAWVGYHHQKEKLFVSRGDGIGRAVVAEGEFFRPSLAAGSGGTVYLAVSVHTGDTWRIGVAMRSPGGWQRLQPISNGGPDLYPHAALDRSGNLWVVWQGYRNGRSRILARRFDGKQWSDELAVSDNTGNAWEPSIAIDSQGRVHFAWDAYDDGAYNIYYRLWQGAPSAFGAQRQITHGRRFQAHASIACDQMNRAWIAWDDGGPNWGKDTGFLIPKGIATALYEQREPRMAVLGDTGLLAPAVIPKPGASPDPQLPPPSYEQPQLLADSRGNIWCLLRRRTVKLHEVWSQSLQKNRLQEYSLWDYAALHYNGGAWSEPLSLPYSFGRNDLRASFAAAGDGHVLAAWTGDGRSFSKPYPFVKNEIYSGDISPLPYSEASLQPAAPAAEELKPVHPQEAEQVARLRAARIQDGAKQLRIFRGDLHRHSDISFDGDIDGSVWDFYRYTIDAANFDYSALTDHNAGDDNEYFWWIIQKSNDLFHYPGRFVPIYAYERSIRYPNGHRNLLWAYRGVRTLPRSQAEDEGKEGAAKLYDYLRRTTGIALPHTSATLMGTDWRDNDPNLDVLVEIYQGDRTSQEYDGAPRAATASNPLSQPGGFAPKGFVWNAWAKGYKIGVESSSDHASTHVSYSIVLAEDYTRKGLLDAMRARHAYAATDNILLDVHCGDHIQGDIFQTSQKPRVEVRIEGTAPVAKVEVIKNNKFVFSSKPNKSSMQFVYEDRDAQAGESYYYVRIQQADTQMAWSSPLWVTYKP